MNYITILFFFRDKYFINISIIYIKDFFVFIVKVAFLDISVVKIYVFFRSLLYTVKTKSKKKIIIIMGGYTCSQYIFYIMLIDLCNCFYENCL